METYWRGNLHRIAQRGDAEGTQRGRRCRGRNKTGAAEGGMPSVPLRLARVPVLEQTRRYRQNLLTYFEVLLMISKSQYGVQPKPCCCHADRFYPMGAEGQVRRHGPIMKTVCVRVSFARPVPVLAFDVDGMAFAWGGN